MLDPPKTQGWDATWKPLGEISVPVRGFDSVSQLAGSTVVSHEQTPPRNRSKARKFICGPHRGTLPCYGSDRSMAPSSGLERRSTRQRGKSSRFGLGRPSLSGGPFRASPHFALSRATANRRLRLGRPRRSHEAVVSKPVDKSMKVHRGGAISRVRWACMLPATKMSRGTDDRAQGAS